MPPTVLPHHITLVPLPDPTADTHGYGPDSEYGERCYLPLLGPSSWLLYRNLARRPRTEPGTTIDLTELAREIGLPPRLGRRDPLARALGRLQSFGLAEEQEGDLYAVKRRVRALSGRQAAALPPAALRYHLRALDDDAAR